jgi:hypothetical protein
MIHIPRDELVKKLGKIGSRLVRSEGIKFKDVAHFIRLCTEEFGLIEEESKTMVYYIVNLDSRGNLIPPGKKREDESDD